MSADHYTYLLAARTHESVPLAASPTHPLLSQLRQPTAPDGSPAAQQAQQALPSSPAAHHAVGACAEEMHVPLDDELLTPEQQQSFIVNGFLHLEAAPELMSLHQAVCSQANEMGKQRLGQLGNNILPAIPALAEVHLSDCLNAASYPG